MRKLIHRVGLVGTGLLLGTGILLACSDDDTVILDTPDSGRDQFVPDSPAPVRDGNTSDTSVVSDTGSPDTGSPDADADAGPRDAQADVALPPVDSGAPDADPGILAMEFPGRVASEICRTTARCCYGDANLAQDAGVDGGRYDATKCFNNYLPGGFDQSNPGTTVDFAKVTLDQSRATECLSRISVLGCGANAAEYRALLNACYAALNGTGAAGAACKLTAECQPGFFCNTSINAGTCEAIRQTGAVCGDWTASPRSQHACSNRFSGQPPRFCRNLSDAGTVLPTASWKCDDSVGLNQQCFNNSWCDGNTVCATSGPLANSCQGFTQLFQQTACDVFVAK